MDAITVGQIAAAISLVAGIIAGLRTIGKTIGKCITKWLQGHLEPIANKLDAIDARFDAFDMDRCKDYLVHFIGRVDQGYKPSETELERFFENYDRYTELGGNSYVKTEVERLRSAGKLRRS